MRSAKTIFISCFLVLSCNKKSSDNAGDVGPTPLEGPTPSEGPTPVIDQTPTAGPPSPPGSSSSPNSCFIRV